MTDQVRRELARLAAELDPRPRLTAAFGADPDADLMAHLRVTRADVALALSRPSRLINFAPFGLAAAVLCVGAWLVSAWGPLMPAAPAPLAPTAANGWLPIDSQRMTQVQSAPDVVRLWAKSGASDSQAIRGQLWWSPSEGVALWAKAAPLADDDADGYQAWLVSDKTTNYLGPVKTDASGTITASFASPAAAGRPVRVVVTRQARRQVDHLAGALVLEATF